MTIIGHLHTRAVFGRRVRVLAQQIAALLPPHASVLDVGSGDGSLARAILELRPDATIRGIDVLIRPETRIEITPFDGRHIPFDDRSFDVVTLVDVLHHTTDPIILLREAARVSSGAIIIKDHLAESPSDRMTLRLMDWVGNAHHGVDLVYNYWPAGRWQRAFVELDLHTNVWTSDLHLYPRPAHWLFDRGLHVVCSVAVTAPASS